MNPNVLRVLGLATFILFLVLGFQFVYFIIQSVRVDTKILEELEGWGRARSVKAPVVVTAAEVLDHDPLRHGVLSNE